VRKIIEKYISIRGTLLMANKLLDDIENLTRTPEFNNLKKDVVELASHIRRYIHVQANRKK